MVREEEKRQKPLLSPPLPLFPLLRVRVVLTVMSCLITALSSAISCAGSSNMLERFASCARRSSFWLVPWMPCPMRLLIFANSDWVPVVDGGLMGSRAMRGALAASPLAPEAAASVLAARSAAAMNSLVRSLTVMDVKDIVAELSSLSSSTKGVGVERS